MRLDKAIALFERNKPRYEAIEKQRKHGVPAVAIFGIHGRESDWDFTCHLANGDSLLHKTVNVPKGRIPNLEPPYEWEVAAEDALYTYDQLDQKNWHDIYSALTNLEYYNGSGYRKYHPTVASPYIYSGTSEYFRGKYSSDGKFDPLLVDKQLGIGAEWRRMLDRGMELPFEN